MPLRMASRASAQTSASTQPPPTVPGRVLTRLCVRLCILTRGGVRGIQTLMQTLDLYVGRRDRQLELGAAGSQLGQLLSHSLFFTLQLPAALLAQFLRMRRAIAG